MQKSHQKAIKGMSIACIVLAGIGVVSMLVATIAFAAIGPSIISALAAWDPNASSASVYDAYGHHGNYYYDIDDIYGLYGDDFGAVSSATAAFIVNICIAVCVFFLLLSVVALIAGIIALRNCNNPSKYGSIMGWSIAGAICAGISCSIASLVLFIIIAVFAGKDKKMYAMGYVPDAAGNFYAPGGVAYGQPGAPMPMPVVPVPPAEGATAQQPVETQQPAPVDSQPVTAQAVPELEAEAVVVETVQSEAPASEGSPDGETPAPAGQDGEASDSDGATHPQP